MAHITIAETRQQSKRKRRQLSVERFDVAAAVNEPLTHVGNRRSELRKGIAVSHPTPKSGDVIDGDVAEVVTGGLKQRCRAAQPLIDSAPVVAQIVDDHHEASELFGELEGCVGTIEAANGPLITTPCMNRRQQHDR
jgi:hypothetical protein